MRLLSRSSRFRAVSLLLLALFVPVQAAGCCKLGALLGDGIVAATDGPGLQAMSAGHSCCPKPAGQAQPGEDASAAGPAGWACETGGTGCCLESAGPSEPGLLASPVHSHKAVAEVRLPPHAWPPHSRVEPGMSSGVPARAGDRPLYLVHRSLLI